MTVHIRLLVRGSILALLIMLLAICRAAGVNGAWEFFSQKDAKWQGDQLGTCDDDTIGSAGCAMTAVAMALKYSGTDADPHKLNEWLTSRGDKGYVKGCNIVWDEAARYPGSGPEYMWYVGNGKRTAPADLKAAIDGHRIVIARSNLAAQHWGIVRGYRGVGASWSDFYYWDPNDTGAKDHQVDDGLVRPGNATQVFQGPEVVEVDVPAKDEKWMDSRVELLPDDVLAVAATGTATYGVEGAPFNGDPVCEPDGTRFLNGRSQGRKFDRLSAFPNFPIAALLGLIAKKSGNEWRQIGKGVSGLSYKERAHVLLRFNDARRAYWNNKGSYHVTLRIWRSAERRPK
jgi:hypothetical protein